MARTKRKAPDIGHNHRDLNDDEMGALVTSFTTKIIAANKEVDLHAANLGSARKVVNGLFKLVAKETGYTRKEFEAEVIANLDRSEEELIADAQRKHRLQVQAGLRSGEQLDLIERINDTVDDAIAAEAAGYRAGRRADDPTKMPDHISPIFAPDFQKGYTRGQEVNAKAEAMAVEILAARAQANGQLTEAPEDEPEDDGDEDLDAMAKKVEAAWAKPRDEEATFEDAAA